MAKITQSTKFTFGANKGTKLRDVPKKYLQWCEKNLKDTDFHDWGVAATEELQRRKEENDASGSLEEQANRILRDAGFDPNNI